MGEAYGGGVLGRLEQFYDAIPGGMRGPQAPIVRMVVTGGITYGALLATAPINSLMFDEDGSEKPVLENTSEGLRDILTYPKVCAAVLGAMAGTFV